MRAPLLALCNNKVHKVPQRLRTLIAVLLTPYRSARLVINHQTLPRHKIILTYICRSFASNPDAMFRLLHTLPDISISVSCSLRIVQYVKLLCVCKKLRLCKTHSRNYVYKCRLLRQYSNCVRGYFKISKPESLNQNHSKERTSGVYASILLSSVFVS